MNLRRRLRTSVAWRLVDRLATWAEAAEPLQWNAAASTRFEADYTVGRTHLATTWDDPGFAIVPLLAAALAMDDDDERLMFLDNGVHEVGDSPMFRRYRTIGERFGLSDPSPVADYPAWAAARPWVSETPDSRLTYSPKAIARNRRRFGIDLEAREVPAFVENPDERLWRSQAVQYNQLIASIRQRGVVPRPPLPVVELLVSGGDHRWVIGREGNHRARLYRALGLSSFTANIVVVVDIAHVDAWPNVRNGSFSSNDARTIFWKFWNGSGLPG